MDLTEMPDERQKEANMGFVRLRACTGEANQELEAAGQIESSLSCSKQGTRRVQEELFFEARAGKPFVCPSDRAGLQHLLLHLHRTSGRPKEPCHRRPKSAPLL